MTETSPQTAEAYTAAIADGSLSADISQAGAIAALSNLEAALRALNASSRTSSDKPAQRRGLFGWSRREPRKTELAPLKGIYLHGPVGRGKSTVMDLFHTSLPDGLSRRVHFHAFMLDVHKDLVRLRDAGKKDPVDSLAEAIANDVRVLCFDEFVITNIADAMILGRLYERMRAHGVIWVATSNFPPQRLYEGGLQRERFLPFIDLVEKSMTVIEVDHGTDYRRAGAPLANRYFTPITPDNRARFEESFELVLDGKPVEEFDLALGPTRRLALTAASTEALAAKFSFAELFEQPLGAGDYLTLAQAFDCLFLSDVPKLSADNRNEARRFMTFIDAVYEADKQLILLAAAPADHLYPDGDGAFEFKRSASRLIEMQSAGYGNRRSS